MFGSDLVYFLTDHLGSVAAVTDASGVLVGEQPWASAQDRRYLPFGRVRADVGTPITQTDFGYTGQRALDVQGNTFPLGLMDYQARFYDSALGRFTQPDTITPGGPQGLDRYSYTMNNPIDFNDPTGHCVGPGGHDFPDGSAACNADNSSGGNTPPATDPCKIDPGLPACTSESPSNYPPIFYKNLTEDQLLEYFQSQSGDKSGCGPFTIAMAANLYNGKIIYQGADVEKTIEANWLKIPGYGMPTGLPFSDFLRYFSGGQIDFSDIPANIGDVEQAIENNKLPVVAICWQTDFQILSDIKHATVGHWMVVVGFDPQRDQLYFLNSGLSQVDGSKSLWSYWYSSLTDIGRINPTSSLCQVICIQFIHNRDRYEKVDVYILFDNSSG